MLAVVPQGFSELGVSELLTGCLAGVLMQAPALLCTPVSPYFAAWGEGECLAPEAPGSLSMNVRTPATTRVSIYLLWA